MYYIITINIGRALFLRTLSVLRSKMTRLNKFLAECGVGSRRVCDKLIADGVVTVNGKTAELGTMVGENDRVTVNGKRVENKQKLCYIMLHKPKGYVTTVSDDLGRKTVMDLVHTQARVYPVGRLDYDTEGLLLLTDDGELANRLTHPRNEVNKTYVARVSGAVTEQERIALEKGVLVDGVKTAPARVRILSRDAHHTRCEVTVHEGRNHQVRKMFEAVGKEVEFLKRVAIGDLRLGGLSRGESRFLTESEIDYIKNI